MQPKAWPFLIASNKVNEFRTVVAPGPLGRTKAAQILRRAVGGSYSPSSSDSYSICHLYAVNIDGKDCEYTLLYRTVFPTPAEVGMDTEIVTDGHGRQAKLIEGLLIEGDWVQAIRTGGLRLRQSHFAKVHQAVLPFYNTFRQSDEYQPTATPYDNVISLTDDQSLSLNPDEVQKYNASEDGIFETALTPVSQPDELTDVRSVDHGRTASGDKKPIVRWTLWLIVVLILIALLIALLNGWPGSSI